MKKKLQIHLEGLDDKVSRFGTSLKHLQLMEVIFYLEKKIQITNRSTWKYMTADRI